ncbi:MAG TPA: hypothetical protein VNM40_03415 [Candidatus Paceibacterota bacterium]|nr:hypothetical protein [Candidatus Paceibacterota bacterium]
MADTVITPATREDSGASAVGWAIAAFLLLGIIFFGIFVWSGLLAAVPSAPAPAQNPTIDVNLSVPEGAIPGANSGGNTNQNQGSGNPGTQQAQ